MCNSDPVLNVYRKSTKPSKKTNSSEPPDQEILFFTINLLINNDRNIWEQILPIIIMMGHHTNDTTDTFRYRYY